MNLTLLCAFGLRERGLRAVGLGTSGVLSVSITSPSLHFAWIKTRRGYGDSWIHTRSLCSQESKLVPGALTAATLLSTVVNFLIRRGLYWRAQANGEFSPQSLQSFAIGLMGSIPNHYQRIPRRRKAWHYCSEPTEVRWLGVRCSKYPPAARTSEKHEKVLSHSIHAQASTLSVRPTQRAYL